MGDGTKGRQEALCCLSGGSAEDRLEQEVGLEYRVVSGIGATESRGQRMGEPGAIKGAQHAVTHVDPRLEALQAQPFLSYRKWQEKRQLQQQQRQQQQAKPRCVCQQEPFQQPQYAHSSSDGGVIGAHYPGGASLETLDSHLQLQQRPISQPQHQQGQQMWVATLAACAAYRGAAAHDSPERAILERLDLNSISFIQLPLYSIIEHKNAPHSQVLEPSAPSDPPDPH
eukprot:1159931-Pelagomonas_calceolata.AAC.1